MIVTNTSGRTLVIVPVSLGCHDKTPYAGWLKQQTLIFSQSGDSKSKSKGSLGFVFAEAFLSGLGMPPFCHVLNGCSSVGVQIESEISGAFSSSYKDNSLMGLGPYP